MAATIERAIMLLRRAGGRLQGDERLEAGTVILDLADIESLLLRGIEESEPLLPLDEWRRPFVGLSWAGGKAAGYSDGELETAWQGLQDQETERRDAAAATPSSDPTFPTRGPRPKRGSTEWVEEI